MSTSEGFTDYMYELGVGWFKRSIACTLYPKQGRNLSIDYQGQEQGGFKRSIACTLYPKQGRNLSIDYQGQEQGGFKKSISCTLYPKQGIDITSHLHNTNRTESCLWIKPKPVNHNLPHYGISFIQSENNNIYVERWLIVSPQYR